MGARSRSSLLFIVCCCCCCCCCISSIAIVWAATDLNLLNLNLNNDGDVNKSSSSSSSSSSNHHLLLPQEEDDDDSDDSSNSNSNDDLDGGFSSFDGMLHWAIGHSDPAKLKETSQRLSPTDLKNRQLELQELMERLKTPSDAHFMKIALDDLNNASLSLQDRHRALQELLILVEPIHNANDLEKLGGLVVIIRELDSSDPEARTSSAWILGKSSQNNPLVQKQILELGALAKLMKMIKSNSTEEAVKALYAISALIRNNLDGQELFYAEAGGMMLQDIMSNSSIDIRLRKKAVFLVGDLAECQLEATNGKEIHHLSNRLFLKSVVDLTTSDDLDLQEKTLVTIKNLLQLETTEALVVKDFCGLDKALERMRQQLEHLMVEEYQRDYVIDVESVRREVELMFYRKLGKVRMVPTSNLMMTSLS